MRACIFCGGRPVTREHAVATWLLRVLDDMEPGPERDWNSFYNSGGVFEQTRDYGTGAKIPEVVVRVVCSGCNHGWMSDLEQEARPFLEQMVRGRRTALDAKQQMAVARWASKTMIVLERHEHAVVVTQPEDRRFVMEQGSPPPHHSVRLAYRSQAGSIYRSTFLAVRSPQASREEPDCFSAILVLGFLVIQIFGGHGYPREDHLGEETTASRHAVPASPPVMRGIVWPPAKPVEDEELRALTLEPVSWAVPTEELAAWWEAHPEDRREVE